MKFKFDSKSLKFKLWAYFALFAALLMLILWFLQIFFLRSYYQEMKITETRRIANTIISQYGQEDFFDSIDAILGTNDLYIHIETADGSIIFSPISFHDESNDSKMMNKGMGVEGMPKFPEPKFAPSPSAAYMRELQAVREKLMTSTVNNASIILAGPRSDTKTLAYGVILDDTPDQEVILYIFSPLYPVESTVSILANQLIYVTIISLILAFFLSFYLSNRIARPIREITKSATKLAQGEYGITFSGGHYTEIIHLADTLTLTSKELAKADNLQKDLIANVSHELRTPLTMVKSYAEMIRDISGNDPTKRLNHLQVIIDEADRLNVLVGDLLVLSKMQSGVDTLHMSTFNLKETVQSILHSFDIFKEQDNFKLILQCPSDIFVTADEARMKQVVSNLINNAIRYSGETKAITVTISLVKDRVRCEITDAGQGIAANELEHIWERYYKSSSNHSRNTVGSGLGLSIVKEILLLHHATFGVESELGVGSTFWFELKETH